MTVAITHEQYRNLVECFSESIPALLAGHPSTAELAIEVERMAIEDSLDARFTVAIVGQMKVGKSTLVNALLGRDLAPVGQTETTATINRFRHGAKSLQKRFRVHWRDGRSEDRPLADLARWTGNAENAVLTRELEFFVDSDFLERVDLVDTPGTRSVVDAHERAVLDFVAQDDPLARKQDQRTRTLEGRADAVIYLVRPWAGTPDEEVLSLFGEETRLLGASPYNSIALVQLWETLDGDPLVEAQRLCKIIAEELADKVAAAIPTSGLLARAVRLAPSAAWASLAHLARDCIKDDLDLLCAGEDFFTEHNPRLPLNVTQRQALLDTPGLDYTAIRFLLRLAHDNELADGRSLRDATWKASGMDRLLPLLKRRFFNHAEMIKASRILRKAWGACDKGYWKLLNSQRQREDDLDLGKKAIALAKEAALPPGTAEVVLAYMRRSLHAVQGDMAAIGERADRLYALKEEANESFRALEADIQAVAALDGLGPEILSNGERAELRRIFGVQGSEPHQRLGFTVDPGSREELIDAALELLERWTNRTWSGITDRTLPEHVCSRLYQILDHLEH